MAELNGKGSERQLKVRHRSRFSQIGIFFGKFLRMFVYQNDWKVVPMAALIAGLVGFVLGRNFGHNMEGTMLGAFAMVCVCIWNGSFNSIQVVVREREVVKREHRSGMHISAYIMAHMMYQLLLCILETVVTIVVLFQMGMKFLGEGLFTPLLMVDVGITMLLITYASDMLSLWISTVVHTTTAAMTFMPFVLIFQLVFSGGIFSLPKSADPIKRLTVSYPGYRTLSAQMDLNSLPYSTVVDMLNMVDDVELKGKITAGQILDALGDTDSETIAQLRNIQIANVTTVREICEALLREDAYEEIRSTVLVSNITIGQIVAAILDMESLDEALSTKVGVDATFGEVVDYLAANEMVQGYRDTGIDISTTLGDILDLVGREETQELIERRAAEAMYNPEYDNTKENIIKNWITLLLFIVALSLLSIISLEFVDKDKR